MKAVKFNTILVCFLALISCGSSKKSLANTEESLKVSTMKLQSIIENDKVTTAVQDFESLTKGQVDVELSSHNQIKSELDDHSSSFYIKAEPGKLTIYGTENPFSYINGLYYYIDQMGYRFFNYSERWVYKPKTLSYPTFPTKLIQRKAENLGYFGTGGMGLDRVQQKNVRQYNARNGWTGTITGVPHMFHYFYKNNKAYIDKNPGILSDYDSRKIDPDLDHPLTMPLIKKWVKEKIVKQPDRYRFHFPVAPADGLSNARQKLPKSLPFIKNAGDKNIYIANEVMKYLEKELPEWKGLVSYNVYGNGTGIVLAPDFPLHERVFLQLIPYAFQRDYATAEEMVEDWNTKHPNNPKSIYDYWNITQWSEGLPVSDFYYLTYKKMPFWAASNLNGIKMESTYFSGATAPHLWVTSRYFSGYTNQSLDELYEEYYTKSFGKGASEIEAMYKRWSKNFAGEAEIPFALQNLNKAYNLAEKVEEKNRIVELMAYVRWMKLHYATKNDQTVKNAVALERYAKKIRSLGVTQSYTVWRYNYGKVKPYGFGKSPDKWEDYLIDLPFETLKAEVLENFYADLAAFPVTYALYENKVNNASFQLLENKEVSENTYLSRPNTYSFNSKTIGSATFKWIAKTKEDKLVINQGLPSEKVYTASQIGKEIITTVPLTNHTEYTVSFVPEQSLKSQIKYTLPGNLLFLFKNGRFASANARNTWYVYVPEDVKEILIKPFVRDGYDGQTRGRISAMFAPNSSGGFDLVEPKVIRYNKGKPVYEELYEGTYKLDVPASARGKVWKVLMRVDKWEIVNFEPIMSRTNFKVATGN